MVKKSSVPILGILCLVLLVSAGLFVSCSEPVTSVANPTFSNATGTYIGSRNVTLSSGTDGATIYYTDDGTTPTSSSTKYVSPLPVSVDTTLKAIAVKDGLEDSQTTSVVYEILDYDKHPTLLGTSGGFVFYDKGSYSDGWRYLEAAENTWSGGTEDPEIQWGAYDTSNKYQVSAAGGAGGPATGTALGAGKTNTENIENYHNELGNSLYPEKGSYYNSATVASDYDSRNNGTVAAKVCSEYTMVNGSTTYDDWYLPSKDELGFMHNNLYKNQVGGFFDDGYSPSSSTTYGAYYWSSTEKDYKSPHAVRFGNYWMTSSYKWVSRYVRPVRAF